MPSLLAITSSFLIFVAVLPAGFAALIYFVEASPAAHFESNSFSKLLVLLHFGDQHFIEFPGGIASGQLQFCLEGGHFDEAREVASGPHRDNHVGNVNAQNRGVLQTK